MFPGINKERASVRPLQGRTSTRGAPTPSCLRSQLSNLTSELSTLDIKPQESREINDGGGDMGDPLRFEPELSRSRSLSSKHSACALNSSREAKRSRYQEELCCVKSGTQ